jgi:hypothetical protein
MRENFVDIIGYQHERVHTGVIAWLFDSCDSRRSPLPISEQAALVRRLAPSHALDGELDCVSAKREYSFGRRLRIDLVLELRSGNGTPTYLLIECKTDSDASIDQLKASAGAFADTHPGVAFSAILLALGAAQVTLRHQEQRLANAGYIGVDLAKAVEVFSGLSISGRSQIYDDWVAALTEEYKRAESVDESLREAKTCDSELLVNKGYRLGRPLFYQFYDKLRHCFDGTRYAGWEAGNAGNNPVLTLQEDHWLKLPTPGRIRVYWEFNWSALCFKAQVPAPDREVWGRTRPQLVRLAQGAPRLPSAKSHSQTRNKRGEWVTAYKWDFDVCMETPATIAETTSRLVVEYMHKQLPAVDWSEVSLEKD